MNITWPISTPTLKNSSARGMAFCGKPDLRQRAGKSEAVQQAEAEGDDPRRARRQPLRAAPLLHDLDGDEHDRERDRRLNQRAGHVDDAQRGQRQGDRWARVNAVTVCSRRLTPPTSSNQGQHEQQMVEAGEDVFDAQQSVGPHHLQRRRGWRTPRSWATAA